MHKPSVGKPSLASTLRTIFQLYQYVLNSPDTLMDHDAVKEMQRVLAQFFGDRNNKSMQHFTEAVQTLRQNDAEIELFCRFLEGAYDTDDLSFFLHGWSKIMSVVFSATGPKGSEHAFLKWGKLSDAQCHRLAAEVFDDGQWDGTPFWPDPGSQASSLAPSLLTHLVLSAANCACPGFPGQCSY